MDLYYQNETLYIDLYNTLTDEEYFALKKRIFRITSDYDVDKVIVLNHRHFFHNRFYLQQMKQDFLREYQGEFLIK